MINIEEEVKKLAPIRYWIATNIWKGEIPMHYACASIAEMTENLQKIEFGKRILFPQAYIFPINLDLERKVWEVKLKDETAELDVLARLESRNLHGGIELHKEIRYINGGDSVLNVIIGNGRIAEKNAAPDKNLYLEGLMISNSENNRPKRPGFTGRFGPMLPVNY